MRHATLFACSTAHLPVAERRHIDHLITTAPRGADGRVEVGHPDLVIEPYAYGFFVHTCVVACGGEAPDISPEFWAILRAAFDRDASWVLFDRDEPAWSQLPTFADANQPEDTSHDQHLLDATLLAQARGAGIL
ncbi:hypothetical protein HL653_12435 [Sphingomonas sp. AP4-R1]|uniref:DUF5983 family protein n=1 Tax=Sphingomonas sp. AP4-R1 TaxID=2735134 RepID=UPI001493AA81|nr:hypothetical protein [Sphingomonas sp. AP4-R1]QJU58466.1 hypothetical protein HL653_12435 [Sphingomonas sp. AP4-R1]